MSTLILVSVIWIGSVKVPLNFSTVLLPIVLGSSTGNWFSSVKLDLVFWYIKSTNVLLNEFTYLPNSLSLNPNFLTIAILSLINDSVIYFVIFLRSRL